MVLNSLWGVDHHTHSRHYKREDPPLLRRRSVSCCPFLQINSVINIYIGYV